MTEGNKKELQIIKVGTIVPDVKVVVVDIETDTIQGMDYDEIFVDEYEGFTGKQRELLITDIPFRISNNTLIEQDFHIDKRVIESFTPCFAMFEGGRKGCPSKIVKIFGGKY